MKAGYGEKAPEVVNVFIEIPMGSNIKYEYDDKAEIVKVDRVLYTSMSYPFNYGFVPMTRGEDHDPIDVLVISNQPFAIGTLVEARVIGMVNMRDEEGIDTKVLAVPKDKTDPSLSNIKNIADLPEPVKNKIKHFFEHYKELEPNKWVKIEGFEDADAAKKKVLEAIERKAK